MGWGKTLHQPSGPVECDAIQATEREGLEALLEDMEASLIQDDAPDQAARA